MALSAYEIRVIVSAQDHFSSAFRRINNDLRYMSRMQQRAARETANLNKQLNAAHTGRKNAMIEARSLKNGAAHNKLLREQKELTKTLNGMQDKRNKLLETQATAAKKSADGLTNLRAAQKKLLEDQTKFSQQTVRNRQAAELRAAVASRKAERTLSGLQKAKAPAFKIRDASELAKAARLRLASTGAAVAELPGMRKSLATRVRDMTAGLAGATSAHKGLLDSHKESIRLLDKEINTTRALADANRQGFVDNQMKMKDKIRLARQYNTSVVDINKQLGAQFDHMQKLDRLERNRAKMQAAGHTGRLMTMAGGIGLAAGAGLANYAANFERQVTLSATQTPGTTGSGGVAVAIKNAERLKPELLNIVKTYGVAADEVTKATYDIFSSIRFEGSDAQRYTSGLDAIKLSAMAAVGGLTDMETAAKATIILANQFGSSTEQMSANLDTAFAIVKYGNMTFAQFTSMMTKVGSAASRAGFSLQDVSGLMVQLTKKSGKPDEAATWIDRMLQALQTPEFIKGMRLLHAPIDKDGKLNKPSKVIDQILRLGVANKGRGGLGMQNLIPYVTSVGKHGVEGGAGLRSTIQAQRGLTFSVQDIKGLKQAQDDVTKSQGEFMRSFQVVYDSAGYKWQRLMAGFQAAALELGIALLPVMTKIVGSILYLIQTITSASPHTKRLIAWIFAIGSALVFVTGLFVSITAAAGSLFFWFKILGGGSASLAGAGGLGSLLPILGKIGIVAAIVTTTLKGLWDVYQDFHGGVRGNKGQKGLRALVGFSMSAANSTLGMIPGFSKHLKERRDAILSNERWFGTKAKNKAGKNAKKSMQDIIDEVNKAINSAINGKGKGQLAKFNKEAQDALNTVLNQTTTPSQAAAKNKERAQKIVEAQKNILDQASQGLMNMYLAKKTQNESMFGDLFAGPISKSGAVLWRKQFGVEMNVPELLADFKGQLKEFQQGRARITKLKKMGVSGEIISDLQARGAEGVPFLKALIQATPKQVAEFNALMGSKKKVITKATEIDFQTQLDKWMKFGAGAALKIAAGMESEEYAVQKRLNGLASRLWSGVAKTLATQQVTLQYGVAVGGQLPTPGPKNTPNVSDAIGAYTQSAGGKAMSDRWAAMGRAMYANPVGTPGEGFPKDGGSYDVPDFTPDIGIKKNHKSPVRRTSAVEYHDHYHVDGTFLSNEQMFNAALRSAAFQNKQRRR